MDAATPIVWRSLATFSPKVTGDLSRGFFPERRTSSMRAEVEFRNKMPYAQWVIHGAKPHNIPNAFGYGPDFGIGGQFDGFFHPGNKPNDFPWKAWLAVSSQVKKEVVDALSEALSAGGAE